jgi:hypothetical protein
MTPIQMISNDRPNVELIHKKRNPLSFSEKRCFKWDIIAVGSFAAVLHRAWGLVLKTVHALRRIRLALIPKPVEDGENASDWQMSRRMRGVLDYRDRGVAIPLQTLYIVGWLAQQTTYGFTAANA